MSEAPTVPLALDPLAGVVADLWNEQAARERRPDPPHPLAVVLVGVPLSGKSTLARALVAAARHRCLHVENDTIRARITAALGLPMPTYEGPENRRTYQMAWDLMDLGLQAGIHVVHDGTSLTDKGRRGAYDVADKHGVPVAVVFVVTPRDVLDARAETVDTDRREGYEKLGGRRPDPSACTRPHVVVDGSGPVEANLRRLAETPLMAPLFGSGGP